MAILTSCQDDITVTNDEQSTSHISENPYSISEESALAYLADFLADSEPDSRSGKKISVKSIQPIKYNRVASRTQQDDTDCENLLYVANFEDNQGYAILAADERIGDKILVVADTGNMSDAIFYSALELNNSNRCVYTEYPLTGPGFFIDLDDDELFINPNTVILFNDTIMDTLVGNFFLDDIGAENNNGDPYTPTNDSINSIDLLTGSLCVTYAVDKVLYSEENDLQHSIDQKDGVIFDDDGILPPDASSSEIIVDKYTTPWVITDSIRPTLHEFTYWTQHSPFNDLYPKKRKYILFGHRRKAPAGCFPLAMAKLLTYFETPNIFNYNGYTIDWKALRNSYSTPVGKKSAAHLLKGISDKCDSWHFYQGTFTFPSKAASCMRFLGLNNAHTYRYSWERAKEMLDKGCPFIIYSVPGVRIDKSHAWNIDGYKIKERIVTYKKYVDGLFKSERTKTETIKMVHCDFGWGRKGNGYYVSGIFNQKNSDYELDPGQINGDTNYNNYLHIIMYDKP